MGAARLFEVAWRRRASRDPQDDMPARNRAQPSLSHRVRERWHARPRASFPLVAATCVLVTLTSLACQLLGLGHVRIFVALVALYIAMGSFGGTLSADLRAILLYGAALMVFVAAPLLVANWSPSAGAALFVLAIGACGIIAALGERYAPVRLGIGLVTVYSFGYQTIRSIASLDIIAGSFVALGIVVVLRLCAGIPDPDGPLRRSIGDVLVDSSRGAALAAASSWLRGPSRKWSGSSLVGAVQFRSAMWTITRGLSRLGEDRAGSLRAILSRVEVIASVLAGAIRSRRPDVAAVHGSMTRLDELVEQLNDVDPSEGHAMRDALEGLRRVAASTLTRESVIVVEARSIRRAHAVGSVRAAVSFNSDYFRTALRAMVTVAVALVVVESANQPAFALPLLMGAYGVLQPTFTRSLREARRRTLGVVFGALIAILIVSTASNQAATVLSVVALIVAFAYLASSIAVFMGGLVASLTINLAPALHVDPVRYAVGYAIAVMIGAALATTFGHLTIPVQTRERRLRTLQRAMAATATALELVGRTPREEQRGGLLTAFREQQNTQGATLQEGPSQFKRAATALEGLNLLALTLVIGVAPRSNAVDSTLISVARGLRNGARDAVEQHLDRSSDPMLDGVDQFLQAEYQELHSAMTSITSRQTQAKTSAT
jgi:hypothetical protein